jgi:hypothetical protein
VERVAAACEAARTLPFVLTARAENFLHGRPDLDDTIRRLQAFEKVGAEVVYAPGLPSLGSTAPSGSSPKNALACRWPAALAIDRSRQGLALGRAEI